MVLQKPIGMTRLENAEIFRKVRKTTFSRSPPGQSLCQWRQKGVSRPNSGGVAADFDDAQLENQTSDRLRIGGNLLVTNSSIDCESFISRLSSPLIPSDLSPVKALGSEFNVYLNSVSRAVLESSVLRSSSFFVNTFPNPKEKIHVPGYMLKFIPQLAKLCTSLYNLKALCEQTSWLTHVANDHVIDLLSCNSILDHFQTRCSFYYRKRGSASYIVREVHSVREREREREREIQREREREREIQREREREKDGSDITIVALKLAMSFALLLAKNVHLSIGEEFCAFPCQKICTSAWVFPLLNGAEFSLSVAKNVALFETVRILRTVTWRDWQAIESPKQTIDFPAAPFFFIIEKIEKMNQINTKNYWK